MISNLSVAHNFAHNTKKNLRSCNMFWENDNNDGSKRSIYSYGHHFCIAFIDDTKNTCLFSTRGYSSTTSQHKSDVLGAIRNIYNTIFCYDAAASITVNIQEYANQIITGTKKLAGARLHGTWYRDDIEKAYKEAQQYAKYFNLKKRTFAPVEKVYTAYKTMTAKEAAKQQTAYQQKQQKAREAKERAAARRREALAQMESAARVEKWCNGENVYLSWTDTENNVPLRINTRKGYQIIETGKGVIVPISEAKRIAPVILSGDLDQIKNLLINNTYRLAGYSDTVIKFGCHTFNIDYLKSWCNKVLAL